MPVIGEDKLPHYPMKPKEFTRIQLSCREMGASILGGCCGTNPVFISHLKSRLS
jgi:methionine synthase I (cobalamin-dependent)